MPIIRKPDISLSGIQLLGSDILYDDWPSLPGNHLRWNFSAEAAGVHEWQLILNLPRTIDEARDRIRQGFSIPEINGRFVNAAVELVETIIELVDIGNPLHMFHQYYEPSEDSGLRIKKLRIMDTLLLDALDPYLAKMTG